MSFASTSCVATCIYTSSRPIIKKDGSKFMLKLASWHGWFRLKGRSGSGKIHCHWWGSIFNMKETVSSGGIKLLRVVVVVMSLLLVMAGDVETNPGPRKKEGIDTT